MAEELFDTMAVAEGLVIKPANSPYVSGARVWLKYKSRQTTDAVISGATGSLHRPAALLLGRYASDTGRLHYAGRTAHLTDAEAAAVAPLLLAAIGGHPWPAQLAANWRSKPSGYHQVAPLVVVEIRAEIATDQGRRWRHAVRMLRSGTSRPTRCLSTWTWTWTWRPDPATTGIQTDVAPALLVEGWKGGYTGHLRAVRAPRWGHVRRSM
ncbi:hypothetical protein [Actinopolymorpha pittospori]|uniref:ATP-dependent DNA ligase n=1 Tax=Actinopolymorpha pittospori TaxID=648752 RepID=A0A927MV74_9ACTN|nr:hypothetical protein [Actinopolymorpha pittospori]MBE1603912.1 ATP-dependent DNA ligase [Actinopolymorpha pittospori]